MVIAAIYARVSSDRQREENTIASQTAALIDFARSHRYRVPDEWIFEDEGYSGTTLVRRQPLRWRPLLRRRPELGYALGSSNGALSVPAYSPLVCGGKLAGPFDVWRSTGSHR